MDANTVIKLHDFQMELNAVINKYIHDIPAESIVDKLNIATVTITPQIESQYNQAVKVLKENEVIEDERD